MFYRESPEGNGFSPELLFTGNLQTSNFEDRIMLISGLLLKVGLAMSSGQAQKNEVDPAVQYWQVNLLNAQIEDTVALTFFEVEPGIYTVTETLLRQPGYSAKAKYGKVAGRGWYFESGNNEAPCESLSLSDPRTCLALDSLPARMFAHALLGIVPNSRGYRNAGSTLSDSASCAAIGWFTNTLQCLCRVRRDSVSDLPVHGYGCGGGYVMWGHPVTYDSTFFDEQYNAQRVAFGTYASGTAYWANFGDKPFAISRILDAKRIENPYPNGIRRRDMARNRLHRNGRVFASREHLKEWCDANGISVDQIRTLDQGRSSNGNSRNLLLIAKGGEKFRILLLR